MLHNQNHACITLERSLFITYSSHSNTHIHTLTARGVHHSHHQSTDELGEDDLNVVLEALHPAAAKYLFLGVAMNVKMNEIEKIESQCSDPNKCLLKVLSVRLKQIPSLTWRDIDTALRSGSVQEVRLANSIREQYEHLYPSSQEIVQGNNSDSTEESYSLEQEKDSAEEVSETERYQKPSEQPREDEYPYSHRETPMRKTKRKRGKSARKYTQKEANEEVNEPDRYRKPSEKLKMDVNEVVVKMTQQKSPYTKRHSKPGKKCIEKELKHEGETQRKKKATKYDKESQVVCGSQHRHKVKHSEQRAQKEVQIESESESSASSSEQEIVQADNSDSREESNSSEQEEDSAEEVSETERYQKPSEQPRDDESHRETPVIRAKGKSGMSSTLLSKKKSKVYESGGKEKQKTKAVDQSVSDVESKNIIVGEACGTEKSVKSKMTTATCYVSEIGRKKSRKQAPKEMQRENSATSGEEEPSSSSAYSKTREERKASTRKKVLDNPEQVLKKQYEVVIAKHKQPTTVQTESDSENSASCSEEEQSHTPEPKRKIIPAVKYSNENTETMISVQTPGETGRQAETEFYQKADRKRKLSHKHQLTPKHVKLEHYSPTSGEESPSNHSGTEMSIDKSPKTSAEQPNAENSDMEEEQHDTVRRKRVHSDSPPGSPPISQGKTRSDSKSKRKRRDPKRQGHHKRVKRRKKMKQESSSSSETDDDFSSNMLRNVTESENKGLIKAFRRCFGKLCLAIEDPEKAAAELQARRLLSRSTMENFLTSPESQIEKAINLLHALKKRIESRPVRVFTIIEVFLCNEVLKEAGRELWNETGTQTSHFPNSTEVNFLFFQVKFVLTEQPVC